MRKSPALSFPGPLRCPFVCILVLVCAALLLAPTALGAQGTDASITGLVRGSNGVPPGVTITVRNGATGFTARAVSGEGGRFFVPQLPLGAPYTVRRSTSVTGRG